MLRDRMAQRNAQGGLKFPRWIYIVVGLAVIGLIILFAVRGCGGEKAPQELATVTMTSPSDSTVQDLYEARFRISDATKAKNVKIVVKSPETAVKGDKESAGTEIIWRPKETITEPGFYTVSVSGKGVQDGAFYFSIEKKEEPKIEPPIVTPPPAPAPQQGKSERQKTLDELEQKYPVQL